MHKLTTRGLTLSKLHFAYFLTMLKPFYEGATWSRKNANLADLGSRAPSCGEILNQVIILPISMTISWNRTSFSRNWSSSFDIRVPFKWFLIMVSFMFYYIFRGFIRFTRIIPPFMFLFILLFMFWWIIWSFIWIWGITWIVLLFVFLFTLLFTFFTFLLFRLTFII